MPSGGGYAFGPFRLDVRAKRLVRDEAPVALSDREFDVLHALVSRAGEVVSKDLLAEAGWPGEAITDNSLAHVISRLRGTLDPSGTRSYLKNVHARGYRFTAAVVPVDEPHPDVDLDAMLAPHRALIDGRAALETLERTEIARARTTFQRLLAHHAGEASVHVGLANACVLQFESTRAEATPDLEALRFAASHAQRACQLNPDFAEAWATLGFVLERTGERIDALAALRRAVSLEPYNSQHHLRLAFVSWGKERLLAARRVLDDVRDCAPARWLAATVYVARDELVKAERELDAGLAEIPKSGGASVQFSPVALHWLKGLLCLARGADDEAMGGFERELALEPRGHLYAREVTANSWYAIGACRLRQGDERAAREAFGQAIARVPSHAMANAGLALLSPEAAVKTPPTSSNPVDAALACAVPFVAAGDAARGALLIEAVLSSAPPGNAGWLVPIEPLLGVQDARTLWASVLDVLRVRAV